MMSENSATRAQDWRRRLGLEPLAGESGWWAPLSTSQLMLRDGSAPVAAHSAIYYLLDAERPINYWHRLASDDIHVLVEGGPVEYFLVDETSQIEREVLGADLVAGHRPVVTAPAGTTKALRLVDPDGFALIASVVTPAWSPERLRIGAPDLGAASLPAWLDADLVDTLTAPDESRAHA